jgi:predicted DsbA family dithiol-disulfide isomerase
VNEARSLGVSGVPFFVIDRRYGVSGAQATEVFSEALLRAWEETEPSSTSF